MFFVKPYRNRTKFNQQPKTIHFTKYSSHRRLRLNYMLSLTAFIFYYWFLAFTVRIGPIPWLEFGNLNFFRNASYASGIQIPKTKYHKPVEGSRRHLIHISITKSEKIRVNGHPVQIDNFLEAYSQNLIMNPLVQPLLIIDRNCKMDIINQVITEIKKKPCRKIIFCTNDKPYKFKS